MAEEGEPTLPYDDEATLAADTQRQHLGWRKPAVIAVPSAEKQSITSPSGEEMASIEAEAATVQAAVQQYLCSAEVSSP
eukprot:COSAG05_NODE_15654_length_364_cov_0.981132_1_plen_78_part_01